MVDQLTHLIETIRTCGKFGRFGGPTTIMVHEHASHSLGGIVLGVESAAQVQSLNEQEWHKLHYGRGL